MRLLKIIGGVIAILIILSAGTILGASLLIYDSFGDFSADLKIVKQRIKLEFFNRGYVKEISSDDIRYIYQKKCYRQCHGEAAMITAILSPAGWFQVVERMRLKENLEITGREADVIIKYLERTYPTTTSRFSYEVRKKVHAAVWRNDIGHGDIYSDIIYVTPEYLNSIGAEHLIDEYQLKHFHVFIVSFSVHDGEVELFDLDKISFMRASGQDIPSTPSWILRFQTADKHHFEAVVRFKKKGSLRIPDDGSEPLALILKNVGGVKERVFRWSLPIIYPPEMTGQ